GVQQLGTPSELYGKPANLEVARFIGSPTINTMEATIAKNGVVELQGRPLPIATRLSEGSVATVGIRSEGISHVKPANGGQFPEGHPALRARLHRMENLGAEKLYYFDL